MQNKIKMKINSKKAMEKVVAIYWFAILFIVAAACVYLVYSFYGKPYDVREIEANFLVNKIVDCISENGILNREILNSPNFLEQCHITFDVEEFKGWEENQFAIEIFVCEFVYPDGQKNCASKLSFGNQNFKKNCELMSGGKSPFCLTRNSYFIDVNREKVSTKIFVGVRKTEKND